MPSPPLSQEPAAVANDAVPTVDPTVMQETFRRSHLSGFVYPDLIHYPPTLSEDEICSQYTPALKRIIANKQRSLSFSSVETTQCPSSLCAQTITYAGDEVAAALLITELSL